jgi:hypothetical protein
MDEHMNHAIVKVWRSKCGRSRPRVLAKQNYDFLYYTALNNPRLEKVSKLCVILAIDESQSVHLTNPQRDDRSIFSVNLRSIYHRPVRPDLRIPSTRTGELESIVPNQNVQHSLVGVSQSV